jgi:hypothetical protein
MNWSDKALEIAKKLTLEYKGRTTVSIRQDVLVSLLSRAAYEGMSFECDNWVNRPRPKQETKDNSEI